MVSRKDIAKEAGVSATSVSYYVNKNGYVSKEAGQRIQAAIDKLNYHPNLVAQSLKRKSSKQIVFLCNEIKNPFYSQLISSATTAAYNHGYFILFSNIIDDKKYIQQICSYQVSGIFFSNGRIKRELYDTIKMNDVPIVMLQDIDWQIDNKEVSRIIIDNSSIFETIMEHLKQGGYSRVCYISGSSSLEDRELDEKTKRFIKAATVMESSQVICDIFSSEASYNMIRQKFSRENCPDAFVCSNDAIAIGALKAIQEMGLIVPKDVAIVGYDNTSSAVFTNPAITSVDIHTKQLGETIISMLLEKIQGREIEDFKIEPKLVIRESSMGK